MPKDELIAALEKATGPDRELDAAIFAAVYPDKVPSPIVESGYGWRKERGGWWLETGEDSRTPRKSVTPLPYTLSVDAAQKLVPPDCWQEIKGPRKYLNIPTPVPNVWSAYIAKWNHEGDVMGWGATPALAICIAALRAKGDE